MATARSSRTASFRCRRSKSWQPLQVETNDLRNLMLDATKQNVMPISKVRRGKRIDLDQVKRRSSGSSIFVDDPDDVTWETPPAMPQQVDRNEPRARS